MSTRLTIVALTTLTMTSIGLAQSESAPAAGSPPAAAPASATAVREKETLSVDFPDEDIKTILRNVADLFELNLVVPDTLQGKTSIKLRDVTWRQIFSVVLKPVNFSYIENGNIIEIVSNDSLQVEPTSTDVFILNYAKASDIKPTVDGMIDAAAGGKILVDARSNALVVTERPSRMGRIRGIIEQLDKATDQVMIESKFIEITDRDIRNLGVNWAGLQNMNLGVGELTHGFSRQRGANNTGSVANSNAGNVGYLVDPSGLNPSNPVYGTATVDLASGQVVGFNNPSQVTGDVTPRGYEPAVPAVAGTATIPASPGTPASWTALNTVNNTLTTLSNLSNSGGTSRLTSAVFSASEFNVVVSALKTLNTVKVVSNPTIVTLNNTEAILNIGEEFPIPNYQYNQERGGFEVSGFTYKPIGVLLKATPQVNARGTIKMTLEPEVSQRNGASSFGGAGGAQIPIIATRKVKTQVSLQSGYTAGIGGLVSQSKNNGKTKVPVLGDIPGLGKLFSSKNINEETSNLLIFITASTVSADGAKPEEVFDPRAMKGAGVTRDDIPGKRARNTDELYLPEATEEKDVW